MTPPKASVKITAIDNSEITKTYTKTNGLKAFSVSGLSNNPPYYGIISRTGELEIIDADGWFKEQSDNNILPDVNIDIYIDGVLQFSFTADSEITYKRLNNVVKIKLLDSINFLQNKTLPYSLIYTNTNALTVFLNILTVAGITCNIDDETKSFLTNIGVSKVAIEPDSFWNVIQQFVYATRCLFYKTGESYILTRVKE